MNIYDNLRTITSNNILIKNNVNNYLIIKSDISKSFTINPIELSNPVDRLFFIESTSPTSIIQKKLFAASHIFIPYFKMYWIFFWIIYSSKSVRFIHTVQELYRSGRVYTCTGAGEYKFILTSSLHETYFSIFSTIFGIYIQLYSKIRRFVFQNSIKFWNNYFLTSIYQIILIWIKTNLN